MCSHLCDWSNNVALQALELVVDVGGFPWHGYWSDHFLRWTQHNFTKGGKKEVTPRDGGGQKQRSLKFWSTNLIQQSHKARKENTCATFTLPQVMAENCGSDDHHNHLQWNPKLHQHNENVSTCINVDQPAVSYSLKNARDLHSKNKKKTHLFNIFHRDFSGLMYRKGTFPVVHWKEVSCRVGRWSAPKLGDGVNPPRFL